MAKITVPIKINGLDLVIKLLKEFDDNFKFEDDVSEEFKNGFNFFRNALIETLEKLESEKYSKHIRRLLKMSKNKKARVDDYSGINEEDLGLHQITFEEYLGEDTYADDTDED